jgi:hypothetical protein
VLPGFCCFYSAWEEPKKSRHKGSLEPISKKWIRVQGKASGRFKPQEYFGVFRGFKSPDNAAWEPKTPFMEGG